MIQPVTSRIFGGAGAGHVPFSSAPDEFLDVVEPFLRGTGADVGARFVCQASAVCQCDQAAAARNPGPPAEHAQEHATGFGMDDNGPGVGEGVKGVAQDGDDIDGSLAGGRVVPDGYLDGEGLLRHSFSCLDEYLVSTGRHHGYQSLRRPGCC
jgi:hypothetical protein